MAVQGSYGCKGPTAARVLCTVLYCKPSCIYSGHQARQNLLSVLYTNGLLQAACLPDWGTLHLLCLGWVAMKLCLQAGQSLEALSMSRR